MERERERRAEREKAGKLARWVERERERLKTWGAGWECNSETSVFCVQSGSAFEDNWLESNWDTTSCVHIKFKLKLNWVLRVWTQSGTQLNSLHLHTCTLSLSATYIYTFQLFTRTSVYRQCDTHSLSLSHSQRRWKKWFERVHRQHITSGTVRVIK